MHQCIVFLLPPAGSYFLEIRCASVSPLKSFIEVALTCFGNSSAFLNLPVLHDIPFYSFSCVCLEAHVCWYKKICVKRSKWTLNLEIFLKDFLFINSWETHRERKRGRDTGRGRSRLHAGSPTLDPIRGLQDQALGWRQTLNHWTTQAAHDISV